MVPPTSGATLVVYRAIEYSATSAANTDDANTNPGTVRTNATYGSRRRKAKAPAATRAASNDSTSMSPSNSKSLSNRRASSAASASATATNSVSTTHGGILGQFWVTVIGLPVSVQQAGALGEQ